MLKVVAVAITFGGRMGGGVFSPSLMVGALTGLAFGLIATGLLPDVSGSSTLYALAGMGAVAAAVLGAPISTTLDRVRVDGRLADRAGGDGGGVDVHRAGVQAGDRSSFFLTQIERRGMQLAAGPQAYLLAMFTGRPADARHRP